MTRPAALAALALAAALAAGCHRAPKAADPPAATPAATPAPSSPAPRAEGPWQTLAALDTRRPVPLLPMMALHQKKEMQGHLAAIQGILGGLARHDYPAVEKAAKAIASSPQMAMTCRHMGAGAPGFTKAGLTFHHRADAIVAAARRHDAAAVIAATNRTLEACTGCHATYRQDVEGVKAWQAKTGMAPPPMATGTP